MLNGQGNCLTHVFVAVENYIEYTNCVARCWYCNGIHIIINREFIIRTMNGLDSKINKQERKEKTACITI